MLSAFEISAVSAFVINLVLGVTLLTMNPGRRANRYYFFSSIAIASWLAAFAGVMFGQSAAFHVFLVRSASAAAALLPASFDMLRYAIVNERTGRRHVLRELVPWLILFPCITLISFHPAFIKGITYAASGFPSPVNGILHLPYVLLLATGFVILSFRFWKSLLLARGIQREELGYCVLAAAALCFAGLGLAHLVPSVTGSTITHQMLPLCSVFYNGIVAYGIVTKRIMSVGELLRSATAYVLIVIYLSLVYGAVFFPLHFITSSLGGASGWAPHFAAALIMALSVAPAHGQMQRVANRLFINLQIMDAIATVQGGQKALSTIGTIDQITARFTAYLMQAAATEHTVILLREDGHYVQCYPEGSDDDASRLEADSQLVGMLNDEKTPVSVDVLRRLRRTPKRNVARRVLDDMNAAMAVGIHAKDSLEGILFLGRRRSGKIYVAQELDAVQILCDQLGASLENSRLYTAIQDSKLYNDILLEALVSGVIAVDADEQITVFNRQAQVLTGLNAETAVNHSIDALPEPIVGALRSTLESGTSIRDRDLTLDLESGDDVPVRLSSTVFNGSTGDVLGAMVLINDMTRLKLMEEQIRRSDRLSSLGTLAAGMAHEIKNPLVSIKTFSQLMPQQYDDEEFRRTFSELVVREVSRIDTLVTRLLHFARPAKATLAPMHLGVILDDSLQLLEQQIRRSGIVLEKAFGDDPDLIMGDADLLNQAFLNFLLNAVESMETGGRLTVATSVVRERSLRYGGDDPRQSRRIRVDITDTGSGIAEEDLARVFDPFFTTKPQGTGLGLSVSHGIIQEHGATVDVESRVPGGTTFHISFALIDKESA